MLTRFISITGMLIAIPLSSTVAVADPVVRMSFKSQFRDRAFVDMGAPGSSLGDYVVGNGDLTDLKGNRIGSFEVSMVVTRLKGNFEIRWVNAAYKFGNGADSFLIGGPEEFEAAGGLAPANRSLRYTVTGGTGKYAGANGECIVERDPNRVYAINCKFAVLANQ